MEDITLLNLLDSTVINKLRDNAERESIHYFKEQEQKEKAELIKLLPEKSKELVCSYAATIENRMDCFYNMLHEKMFNLGVQMGIKLQKGYITEDDLL